MTIPGVDVLPEVSEASLLEASTRYLYIVAAGFEERSLAWSRHQMSGQGTVESAVIIRYRNKSDSNRESELRENLARLGVNEPEFAEFDYHNPYAFEEDFPSKLHGMLQDIDEIVMDISAMNKLVILIVLWSLEDFARPVRIILTEAEDYGPTREEYIASVGEWSLIAGFPTRGVESIVRPRCLASVRMQGQPVTLIAFASFNEQLVRNMLGTISPHRLVLLNGMPPRADYIWRAEATQAIHSEWLSEYRIDNPVDDKGLLERTASTLDYRETIEALRRTYSQFWLHERIICAATGSKMQTLGLFFVKEMFPDIHIEYPTPDTYLVNSYSIGVRKIHELRFPDFESVLKTIREEALNHLVPGLVPTYRFDRQP